MPRLAGDGATEDTYNIGGTNFTFNAARIGDLGATEYTLAFIGIDITGSVWDFADQLREMLITAIKSLKKSPRSDNLLVRVVLFNSDIGIQELHGYKPLADIDPQSYQQLDPSGLTNLFDAAYSGIGSMAEYGGELMENDFLANGIAYFITDGGDNCSTATARMVRTELEGIRREEKLESITTILIGINAAQCQHELDEFKTEGGLDQYTDAGEATPGRLAKLAAFISQSTTSASQALGTGGPSQNISATI